MTDSRELSITNASPSRRSRLRLLAVAVLTTTCTATAALTVVVYDPGQHLQNLRQVVELLNQIDRAAIQLENQWQMLRRLPVSVGRSLGISGQRLHERLRSTLIDPETQLPELYDRTERHLPSVFSGDEIGWLDSERDAWTQYARDNLVAQRRLQNEVFANHEITALRVEQIIQASNGQGLSSEDRPGQTAVLQARNELLGTLAHETNNVIALRAARLQAEHERHLQTQTANAFHRARRDAVMSTWPMPSASAAASESNRSR